MLAWVTEAYGTFAVKWSVRVVVQRGTNGMKPWNVMKQKKRHVPQANGHLNMLCPSPLKGGGDLQGIRGKHVAWEKKAIPISKGKG